MWSDVLGTSFWRRMPCYIGGIDKNWRRLMDRVIERNQKLTFNRSIIVADGDVVKAALCWHILDCYGPVLVRLDGRLWASCGRHRDRLNRRKTVCSSRSTGAYHTHIHTHTHNSGIEIDVRPYVL